MNNSAEEETDFRDFEVCATAIGKRTWNGESDLAEGGASLTRIHMKQSKVNSVCV